MTYLIQTAASLSAAALLGLSGFQTAIAGESCCAPQGTTPISTEAAPATTQPSLQPAQQQAADAIVSSYLAIQASLVNDKAEGVAEKVKALHDAAHQLSESSHGELKAAADKVADAAHTQPKTLEEARKTFKPLSVAVTRLAHLAPPSDKVSANLYEAHCPMAKASWLQTSAEVANPYMGQSMPTCGSVRETLKGEPVH